MKVLSKMLAIAFILLLTAGMGSCEQINVSPGSKDIEIGGYGEYIIDIGIEDSSELFTHQLDISFHNKTTKTLTDKINGTLETSEPVNLEKVDDGPSQKISYNWTPESTGTYRFTLNITFNKSATPEVGEEFAIKVVDSAEDSGWVYACATAYTSAVPELLTAVLVGAGVISVFLWRRKS